MPAKRGASNQLGILFAHHILLLGEEGFAKWLVDSFGGSEVRLVPGYFHYDGPSAPEVPFDEMMEMVVDEFEAEVLRVGEAGIKLARSRLTPQTSSAGRVILGNLEVMFNPFN